MGAVRPKKSVKNGADCYPNRRLKRCVIYIFPKIITMALIVPTKDGDVNLYNLSNSHVSRPRIYFVNGIRVLGRDHALTASLLSLLTERPIWGIYNRTAGSVSGLVFDVAQCALDYMEIVRARTVRGRSLKPDRKIPDNELPKLVDEVLKKSAVWNQATATLFRRLILNRNSMQYIIAHSQGNLITSNALFAMEHVLGSKALQKVRVYSLASPAPAWPMGLRKTKGGGGRQENAFMNDMVALLRPHNLAAKVGVTRFQNEGDFRTHSESWPVSISPHDTNLNFALNFLKSIRNDLGFTNELSPNFLEECAEKAKASIPKTERSFWQWLDDIF